MAHSDEAVRLVPAPEVHARRDLAVELGPRHVRFVPSVGGNDAAIGAGGVVDDFLDDRHIFAGALSDHSPTFHTVKLRTWAARPTILFAAAYLLNAVLHEVSHALAAIAMRIPAVLFQYRIDIRAEDAAPWEHATIAAAGPVASGGFALLCAVAYRHGAGRPGQLMLLYLAAVGAVVLFGNMMSPVGDFARMEDALDMPAWARSLMLVAGFAGLLAALFAAGRELREWFPADVSRGQGIAFFIALPAIVGTALATWLSQPMPEAFTLARLSESLVWIVAAIAAWGANPATSDEALHAQWHPVDAAVALVAVAAARALVPGIILPA